MKHLNHIYLCLLAALFAWGASACSDDLQYRQDNPVEIETGIVLKIPNLSRAAEFARTRATDPIPGADLAANEGKINNGDMWLFIFDASENPDPDKNFHINLSKISDMGTAYKYDNEGNPLDDDKDGEHDKNWIGYTKEDGTYTYYEVSMYPGKYKAYIVANLSEYLPNTIDWSTISEADLNDLVLNFSDKLGETILQPGHLPMICLPTDVDEAGTDGTFDILSKKVENLHCNLVFQCAKVRYTILFDNSPDSEGGRNNGHSFASFTRQNFLDFGSGSYASNVASSTAFLQSGNSEHSLFESTSHFSIPLTAVQYPESGTDYPKNAGLGDLNGTPDNNHKTGDKVQNLPTMEDIYKKNNEDWEGWSGYDNQRAWQGVIYLPENLSTTRTKLFFDGVVNDGETDLDNDAANPYEITLIQNPENKNNIVENTTSGNATGTAVPEAGVAIERGNFYDLTCLAKGMAGFDITFQVTPFNPQQLIYDLHGPYYLHVDQTNISLTTGEVKGIWYESNADIQCKSPIYKPSDGTAAFEIYEFDTTSYPDSIIVSINSAVKSKYFDDIMGKNGGNPNQYNFFHVKAGNIEKKITVDPFDLGLYLRVDPEEITINAREQVASGMYMGYYNVVLKTNYDEYTIDADNWTEVVAGDGKNTSKLLYLTFDEAGSQRVEFGKTYTTPANGEQKLYLHYVGLNDGQEFWTKNSHKMELNFTGIGGSAVTDGSNKDNVVINTIPSNDNYIIHLKPGNWKNPHIYVYQCLETPGDYTPSQYANKPVGYKEGNNDADWYAALEYSFTGRIAFKGWYYLSNKTALNNWTDRGLNYGFYKLPEEGGSWYAIRDTQGMHYDLNYDFCKEYREKIKAECSSCNEGYNASWSTDGNHNGGLNQLWPGIRMEEEGRGWWRFELTGVATPGKALIMFANGHDGKTGGDNGGRYPGDAIAGVPLFDYPSREGWFDLTTNKTFSSIDPRGPVSGIQTYRIYWTPSGRNYIRFWETTIIANGGTVCYEGTPDGNKLYYEFKADASQEYSMKFLFKSSANESDWTNQSKDEIRKTSSFSWNPTAKRYEYMSNNNKKNG